MTETDIDDVPKHGRSTLKPSPVITPTHQFNWPILSTSESFFERALAGGQLNADGEAVPYTNGDTNDASVLDEWARDDPAADEADTAGEAAWDLDEAAYTADEEVTTQEDADAAAGANPGINESELWARNSPFAADHVAAGSFETAMQVTNLFCLHSTLALMRELFCDSSLIVKWAQSTSPLSKLNSWQSIALRAHTSPSIHHSLPSNSTSAEIPMKYRLPEFSLSSLNHYKEQRPPLQKHIALLLQTS